MNPSNTRDFKELSQRVISANKDHQYALKVYTERLQSELETVDKLLAAADQPEEDAEGDIGGSIAIPQATKAVGPVPHGIIFEESPFAEDAARRQRYLKSTVIHPMKAIELEALGDAVRSENHRLFALEAQRRGQQPFVAVDEHPPGFFHINKVGLNWERIASKVSDAGVNYVQRTAQECEIRWLGDRHPEFNHSDWTQEEIAHCMELVGSAKEGEVDWVEIAAKLGTNRTPLDCMRHTIQRKTHVWTPEADQLLLEAVRIYGVENWQQVARQVSEDATSSQCQSRYTRTLDPNIKRGAWTEEEDSRLRNAVSVFGRTWMDVCVWIPGRNNEQCRERWQELEKANELHQWTEEDDNALLEAHKTVGGSKWVEIAKIIGRTSNSCRHRYAAVMKRRAKAAASSTPPDSDYPSTQEKPARQGKGAPRRRAAQKRAEGTEDPPEGGVNETHTTATATPKPKPKARPRGKRAAPETEQRGDSERNAGGTEASSGRRSRERPAEASGSGSPTAEADSALDNDTSKAGPSKPAAPGLKRGRGRPRKNPTSSPASRSPEKEPASKKRRLDVQSSSPEDTPSSPSALVVASETYKKKPVPRKRGNAGKLAVSEQVDSSTVDAEEQGPGSNEESGLTDGNSGNLKSEQKSSLRRSTRVRKPAQNS